MSAVREGTCGGVWRVLSCKATGWPSLQPTLRCPRGVSRQEDTSSSSLLGRRPSRATWGEGRREREGGETDRGKRGREREGAKERETGGERGEKKREETDMREREGRERERDPELVVCL